MRVDGEMAEWFEMRQGVRQDCPMSLWLFNSYLDISGQKRTSQFSGRSDIEYMQGCLQMTQFWLQIMRRTSNTTLQRSKKQ